MNLRFCSYVLIYLSFALCGQAEEPVAGLVLDSSGGPVANARVELVTASGAAISNTVSTESGAFNLGDTPQGAYLLHITAVGFEPQQMAVSPGSGPLRVTLTVAPVRSEVTVTAFRGRKRMDVTVTLSDSKSETTL